MPARPIRLPSDPTHDSWSAPFGVWLGVPLRLHMTLILVLVVAACIATQDASFTLALALVVYLASLVAHEAAHAVAAWRVGGDADAMVLGLVGGLRAPRLPNDPEARVFVAMAGPMINLAIVVLGTCCLAMRNEPALLELFLPQTDAILSGSLLASDQPIAALARMAIWINWPLFVLNLLPAFPFDGAEAGRSLFWPWLGKRSASEAIGRVGYLTGAVLILGSPLVDNQIATTPPLGIMMAIIGVIVCFGAHRDLMWSRLAAGMDLREVGGPIYSDGHDPFDDFWLDEAEDQMVLVEIKQHRVDQPSSPSPHAAAEEPLDDKLLDEVLAKLHATGLERLSPEERDLLERASRSFRNRRHAD